MEIVVVVEHIQVFDGAFVGDVAAAKTYHLVENGERIAHGAIGFLGDDIQCLNFGCNALIISNILKMIDHIVHAYSLEIVDLAARKNGRNDFVLFSRGQNENSVCWRLFKRFQEGVERR